MHKRLRTLRKHLAKSLGKSPTLKHVPGVSTLRFKFDPKKTAQAVAFLLRLSNNKRTKFFVVKMLYAADRRQMRRAGVPITGAAPVSMEHGPVLSEVLDLLNGVRSDPLWKNHISTASRDTHLIHLKKDLPDNLLTENEKKSLCIAHEVFSKMTKDEAEEYCHRNFKEWVAPGKTSKPIDFETIYKEVGRPGFSEEMQDLQREEAFLLQLLA